MASYSGLFIRCDRGSAKRALRIIYPEVARKQALLLGREKQDVRNPPPPPPARFRVSSRASTFHDIPQIWRACSQANPEAESCMEALQIANIARLKKRRDNLFVKYMDMIKSKDDPLHYILPRQLMIQSQEERRQIIFV